MTDLIEVPATDIVPNQQGFLNLEPQAMVTFATKVANVLKDVIVKQKLSSNIQGRDYVKVEGWSTLGSLLGILPKEDSVTRYENGSYEARVVLVRQSDGRVLSGGSALCGVDETRWRDAPEYARRSMSITRATGKAYRLSFGWIMALAGYEPTPAEEMPSFPEGTSKPEPTKKAREPKTKDREGTDVYQGTTDHKVFLKAVFDELKIIDVEKQKKAHGELLNEKVKLSDLRKETQYMMEVGFI